MKIVQFTAENVKKLKVVDITPSRDFIQITGKNGNGKTSVLDSIWWALAGGKAVQGEPIRQGEEKAVIRLDLGEMVVTRKFTPSGTTLTVENAEGFRAPTPQAMLDTLMGAMSFDPLDFSRLDPAKQFAQLKAIANVTVDLDALAAADKADTEARRDINREVKLLEGQLAGITVADDAPDAPVDVAELLAQLRRIEDANTMLREEEIQQDNAKIRIKEIAKRRDELSNEILELDEESRRLSGFLNGAPAITYKSTDEVKAQIASSQAMNLKHNDKKRHGEINAQIALKQKAADALTEKLKKRDDDRVAALKASDMPIEGLALGDKRVTFNCIPFEQLSAGEQLRVSVAIAMAASPKLRVIRIKDGSLLDDDNLKIIEEMTREKGYQVWVERTDSSGKIGIYLEDGEVVANNYEAAE